MNQHEAFHFAVGAAMFRRVSEIHPGITPETFVELGTVISDKMAPGDVMSVDRMVLEICEEYERRLNA